MANVMTLDDVVKEQMHTNEGVDDLNDRFASIENKFTLVFRELRADRLDLLEMMQELIDKLTVIPQAPRTQEIEVAQQQPTGLGAFGLFGLLGAAVAAFTGAVLGFITGFAESLKSFGVAIKKFFDEKIKKPFVALFDNIRARVQGIKTSIIGGFDKIKASFSRLFSPETFKPITNFFSRLGKIFESFAGIAKTVGGFLSSAAFKGFEAIKTFFQRFINIGSKFFTVFRVIGRIFLPLTILIDGIIRSFEEFGKLGENAGFMDYLQAGWKVISKTLLGIVTIPLDLLKSAISWISEKLGFESISQILDSFSFTEVMETIIDKISEIFFDRLLNPDWWSGLFDDAMSAIADFWGNLQSKFSDFGNNITNIFKDFIKGMLPDKDTFRFTVPSTGSAALDSIVPFAGSTFDLNPFPDSLYRWANEPPPLNVAPASRPSQGVSEIANRNIAMQEAGIIERTASANPIVVTQVDNRNQSTTNNSQTAVSESAPLPSPVVVSGNRAAGFTASYGYGGI